MTLTEFRALAERASPGPWEPWDSLYVGMKAAIVQPAANPLRTIAEVRTNFDDAKFIAAASPTEVIALIDRLERAEATLQMFADVGFVQARAYFDAPAGEGER